LIHLHLNLGYFYPDTYTIIVLAMYKRPAKSVRHLLCGLTMPHRRLMRANHRCAVVIRRVRGACSWPRGRQDCCHCAVVRSAFSETDWNVL